VDELIVAVLRDERRTVQFKFSVVVEVRQLAAETDWSIE
jgi:hypothetical protein